jgi:hypothetical protein
MAATELSAMTYRELAGRRLDDRRRILGLQHAATHVSVSHREAPVQTAVHTQKLTPT